MIKLLVVVNVFYPDRGGGAAVFSDMCYALAKKGIDVTVQCAFPYYPEWNDKSSKNGFKILTYVEKSVKVERYGLFIPYKPDSLLQRMLYEISFFLSLSRSLFFKPINFDVVIVYCPLVASVAYAVLRKLIFKTPVWLNIQDLSAEAAETAGITNSTVINNIFKLIQTYLFNQANICTTISPLMVNRLKRIQKQNKQIEYLPNWANNSLVDCIETVRKNNKQNLVISNPIKLLYAGNIGNKQDLLRFCHVLWRSDVNFQFNIYGNGSKSKKVYNFVSKSGDKRFMFGPFLDELRFAQEIHNTNFFVITEKESSGASFIPSKLIPVISSGKPIFAVCDYNSPLGQEMLHSKVGPCFQWSNINNIPNFLASMRKHNQKYNTWSENAIIRSKFYDRTSIIQRIQDTIQKMYFANNLKLITKN